MSNDLFGRMKWNKALCAELAGRCENSSEFKRLYGRAHSAAQKNGWLREISSHFAPLINPNGYWTKERCAEEALKYSSKSDFMRYASSAYHKAIKNNFLDEICSHMVPLGHKFARYVYEIWSPCGSKVYVGITLDPRIRLENHRRKGPCKGILDNGAEMRVVTELISASEAQSEEEKRVNDYKNQGFVVINRGKTGGLGYCRNRS